MPTSSRVRKYRVTDAVRILEHEGTGRDGTKNTINTESKAIHIFLRITAAMPTLMVAAGHLESMLAKACGTRRTPSWMEGTLREGGLRIAWTPRPDRKTTEMKIYRPLDRCASIIGLKGL